MDNQGFSLMYSALKMFGKQLYSNESSAISELVANGLDANAKVVYVTIDARNTEKSTIEVFDNGNGMNQQDFRNKYMKIGYNKRQQVENSKIMGRKGIGKLAALYLSDMYSIHSVSRKSEDTSIHWRLNVSGLNDEAYPEMIPTDLPNDFLSNEHWRSKKSGTVVIIENANLKGWGDKTFESLKWKLANNFIPHKLDAKVFLKVIKGKDDITTKKYDEVSKRIAFKNMCAIFYDETENLKFLEGNTINIPYKTKTGEEHSLEFKTEVGSLAKEFPNVIGKVKINDKDVAYTINGWIGIHATIDNDQATKNDGNFLKNQLYNPNSVRLYSRNKLALANIIPLLENTRAYAHYLEGDINVDILDDDEFTDIATAGRQDFDHTDPRFQKILEVLKNMARKLVSKRQLLADLIAEEKKREDDEIESFAKNNYLNDMGKELDNMGIDDSQKTEILNLTATKVSGGLSFKSEYTLFISHAGKDMIFTEFIVNLLKKLGFTATNSMTFDADIFYTSGGFNHDDLRPLGDIIKNIITKKDNDVFFLTTPNFKESEYCMFEGGAVWATRSISEYKLLTLDHRDIPAFLDNRAPTFVLGKDRLSKNKCKLDRVLYNSLVKLLNRFIEHLNKNKLIRKEETAPLFDIIDFPDEVELKKIKKSIEDYMDQDILSYWDEYIVTRIEEYAKQFIKQEEIPPKNKTAT